MTDCSQMHEQLKSVLQGLLYTSESDYPLEFICWKKESGQSVDCKFACEQLAVAPDTVAEESDPQKFLDTCCRIEPWFNENEQNMARDYCKLKDLLNKHLSNLLLFRVGEIEVNVVLVGEDAEGNVVGFKTISVET